MKKRISPKEIAGAMKLWEPPQTTEVDQFKSVDSDDPVGRVPSPLEQLALQNRAKARHISERGKAAMKAAKRKVK